MGDEADLTRYPRDDLTRFGTALLAAAGVDAAQTASVVDNLIWNEAAGRRNHGFERLPVMLDRVEAGGIARVAETRWRALGPSLAHLDGGNGFGQHAGRLAVDRAIALARETGVGMVGVAHSNFFGSNACFVARGAEAGQIGFAFSNSFAKTAAHGGTRPVLGTNPLAFAAPGPEEGPVIVDLATAALAGSTLRDHQRRGEPLPEGLVIDAAGAPVTDPATAAKHTLLPAAGAKGFGLALMVEILAGVLTGAGIGQGVGSLYADLGQPANSGHFFIQLDPGRWMAPESFAERMRALAEMVVASGEGVRLPGAARSSALATSASQGIGLTPATLDALHRLAGRYRVAPLQ